MVASPDVTPKDYLDQPSEEELQSPEGDLYLSFYLSSGDQFALPAAGIREVISPPLDRITPVPNTSPLLLGILNFRGQVVWVADLGQFLGDPAPLNTDRAEVPVIAIEDQDTVIALAVDRVVGMTWLALDEIRLPSNVPDNMAPFLRGEWVVEADSNQRLRLLDQVAILRSARWAT